MLANLLAIIIGLGSLAFYLAAFILPEVHRRSDFFWSGVGMFYALVLWFCARQMNGAVLVGQTASVGLLLWLGYQTLLLRRETTPAAQQTPIRLGKSSRLNGAASRPIANDYEFVEDGVEDLVDQEPDPDSPILIKPVADEFAPKLVVPAAIPTTNNKVAPEKKPTAPKTEPTKPNKITTREKKPGPLAAVGIFTAWLKDVVTPKKKAPKPMIELPPRPPSIPKPKTTSEAADQLDIQKLDNSAKAPSQPETTVKSIEPSSQSSVVKETSANPEPTPTNPAPASAPIAPVATQQDDDEATNWPEGDFWD
ncbi:MAG: Ycf66 family protein [Cyanobacteria bacterium P01_F01_bin.13]